MQTGRTPFTATVQPFSSRETTALHPALLGAAEVPPLIFKTPSSCPALSIESKMLSTLVWERAQFVQALSKSVAVQLSNIAAGKEVRLVQFPQAL